MKKTLLLVFAILLLSSVYADGDIGIVKQFECIDLYNYCPTCNYINLTSIKYPNGTSQLDNIGLTKVGNNYQYSFCNTSQLGKYFYTTCGDKAGVQTACEDIAFEVTPSGFQLSVGLYILFMILSAGFVLLGFYIQDNWVIVLGGFGMIFLGLFQLFYGVSDFKDSIYTYGLGIIFLMAGSYFSVRGAYEALS